MFKRRPMWLATLPLTVLLGALFNLQLTSAERDPGHASLESYATADGESYFALSLTPQLDEDRAGAHDVVVLFDTSASQTGAYREKALETLRSFLGALEPEDRVHLMAVDLNPMPMTKGFVAPQGESLERALAKLERRVPLGTTDMPAALRAAADSFAGERPRACIYFGDGMSVSGVTDTGEAAELFATLVEKRVPVSSLAIGPRTDGNFLAALANHTGGMLAVDGHEMTPLSVGRFLAAATGEVVIWPAAVTWPKEFTEVYPHVMPPLRGDRDTIVIGRGASSSPVKVAFNAQIGGATKQLEWTVPAVEPSDDNAHLKSLVDSAASDGGVSLTTVGSDGLKETTALLSLAAHNLGQLGGQALALGRPDQAAHLAAAALRLDPDQPVAQRVERLAQAGDNDLRLDRNNGRRNDGGALGGDPRDDLDLDADPLDDDAIGGELDEFEQRRQVQADKVRSDVLRALNDARSQMRRDPDRAIDDLKLIRETLVGSDELDPDLKAQLQGQIETALQEASRQKVEFDEIQREQAESQAVERERQRAIEELDQRDQKIEQLMAKFNSLMTEEDFVTAETVAMVARDMDRDSTAQVTAVLTARMEGYYAEAYALREARHRGVVDTLASVERSHVPTPDEPPIFYPPLDVWQALTERRRKYASVDLAQNDPSEQRILQALEDPTTLDFPDETPLQDLIDYIADFHSIPVRVDKTALDEAGVQSDQPMAAVKLDGIKLKSALKLILGEVDLAYLIDNEVLLITTKEKSENTLTTKVYPVGDLVLPIPNTAFGGLGGFGGGGQQGGLGGGGGQGGGGGGFGGGQQGGGGGQFAVNDDLSLSKKPVASQAAKANPKKKQVKAAAAKAKASAADAPEAGAADAGSVQDGSAKAEIIALKIAAGADAEAAWNNYFVENPEPEDDVLARLACRAAVRETAKSLINGKEFESAIGMMKAALRNRRGQPWMYEAMGLAMQARYEVRAGLAQKNGQPFDSAERDEAREEIERTLLSAADFTDNMTDLLYIGQYLARSGFDRRALDIFRQVARVAPTQPEAYMHALGSANRLKDVDAIQWATVGILSRAWPAEQAKIWDQARRVALATVEQLKTEERLEEAKAFEQSLNDALIRDCVAIVSWTGDADVDLSVEEPAGTVCSLRNARTTGGGVMLGDTFAHEVQSAGEKCSEVYVCPEGFDGTYRLLLRRVWGKLAGGKASVQVYTNYGKPNQMKTERFIPLGEKDAVVAFELADGRRKEPIEQQFLANAAADQVAIGRELLNQQMRALAGNGGSLSDLIRSRRDALRVNRMLEGRGAVGFQPVIITLPEGAQLNFVGPAVISADRRYVRVSPAPFFSGIFEVNVFNLATGENSSGQGGTGGQGFGGLGGGQGGGGGFGGGGGQGGGGAF